MTEVIGLIAGGGQFPLLFVEAAKAKGKKVVVVGHLNESRPELEEAADALCWVKLGQLGKIISFFKKNNVSEAVFAGTITKTRIFRDVLPDLKGISLWNKIDVRHDDAILRAVAEAIEDEGINILPSTCYLDHLFFPKGLLTKKIPTDDQWEDVKFGWEVAREIGRLDIGQCVVVRERSVMAVEAIEGTDAAIKRGGELARSGAVVVKRKKPNQDFRFDLPATGLKTVETIGSVKGSVLAVEAGQSLLFDKEEMIRVANRLKIVVIGLVENDSGELEY